MNSFYKQYSGQNKRGTLKFLTIAFFICALIYFKTDIFAFTSRCYNALNGAIKDVSPNKNENINHATMGIPKNDKENFAILENSLKDYLTKYNARYSFCFYDFSNDSKISINHNKFYESTKTDIIPVNLYYYFNLKNQKINTNNQITLKKEDLTKELIEIQKKTIGDKISFGELSSYSLEKNDLSSLNILKKTLGEENIKKYISQTVIQQYDFNKRINSKDLISCSKIIKEISDENTSISNDFIKSFIPKKENAVTSSIPKNTKILSLSNLSEGNYYSILIVLDKIPYAISIVGEETNENESIEVGSFISESIYDFITNRAN